jgi:ferredoxin
MQGKSVIGFTYSKGNFVVGTLGPSHKESGCVFCGACVTVCPTGALMEKDVTWKKKNKLTFSPVIFPPEEYYELSEENIDKVPEANGIFCLFDESQETIFIKGTDNIRRDLHEKLQSLDKARYFQYEEHDMYSMRENELLGQYLKKYGALPEVNNEIDDLY